ncbi:MAG: secondary thiamine-phosphate synthase enzyme YjbQ [Methanobrevibacter sp.]|jgi:secondary thiamine-phosphate synthase enzyme|nr:secondary thiamine-phosphate synthase enzyme YjbQ [Methanobrevibacter sp.]
MNIFKESIAIKTNKRFEIVDITDKINHIISKHGIELGIANIFSKHSTSAIIINENESGLLKDIENLLSSIVIDENSYYHDRIDNNADSHLKGVLLSSSQSIPISNNSLNLGTWQSVFFIDFDGPRNRVVEVTLAGQ